MSTESLKQLGGAIDRDAIAQAARVLQLQRIHDRAARPHSLMTPRRITQVPDGCWVACIAGLTDLDHEELAALIPCGIGADEAFKDSGYHNRVNAYTRSRGWRLAYVGCDVPRGFAIGTGKSPRGLDHAVITLDGKVWWDPHPSRLGVDKVTSFEIMIPILGHVE